MSEKPYYKRSRRYSLKVLYFSGRGREVGGKSAVNTVFMGCSTVV